GHADADLGIGVVGEDALEGLPVRQVDVVGEGGEPEKNQEKGGEGDPHDRFLSPAENHGAHYFSPPQGPPHAAGGRDRASTSPADYTSHAPELVCDVKVDSSPWRPSRGCSRSSRAIT